MGACRFDPNGSVAWKNLKTLSISYVKLDEDLIQNLLSGSPALETFKLKYCHGFTRIDVTSKSVKVLVFSGYRFIMARDAPSVIKINAPYTLSLRLLSIFVKESTVAKRWDINMRFDKTKLDKLPLWVRLCNLPLEAWSINGISALASRIGKPLIMDAMTASMCKHGTGRIGYARVLIEVQAKKDFPEKIDVVYHNALKEMTGHKTIQVRYDWTPPLCTECGVFGHSQGKCKMDAKEQNISSTGNDGSSDEQGKMMMGLLKCKVRKLRSRMRHVFRPKVSSSDDTMRTMGANKNVGVIGEKLNKKEQHKTSINGSTGKNTGTYTLSQSNKFEVLNEYEEGELNEMENVHNENSSKEINDVCDMCDGIAKEMNGEDIRGRDSKTHLKNKHLGKVCDKVFGPWNWFSNVAVSDKGLESSDSKLISFMSFVYAANSDFNVTLNAREYSAGIAHMSSDTMEFNDCMNQIEVDDLCCFGLYFTWTKNLHKVKKGNVTGILKKLDRVMVNDDFITTHPSAHAIFMPCLISDHSPVLLTMPNCSKRKKKSFKFPNYITHKKDFLIIVEKGWNIDVEGCSMYSLVKKMKALKGPLSKLNWQNGNLVKNVNKIQSDLKVIQIAIDADPFNKSLIDRECVLLKSYLDVVSNEEKLLYQKSVNPMVVPISNDEMLFKKKLSDDEANFMIREVNDREIKDAMFSIGDNKAPGPDGFSAKFFKNAWHIVCKDVCRAVKEFFSNGQLLGELNATIISLVPKIESPFKVSEFRPIACCNVVYKCISKILTRRIKGCLDKLINLNQSAFIPGRQIQDNILLAQELVKGYGRSGGPKRITCKIDIQKAYDTVKWYFKGGRGLRQGDPLSPYLFTLVMEVFTLIMEKNVANSLEFNYHFGCKGLKITHICFADDLLVFYHGDIGSSKVIKKSLEEFSNCSGLLPNFRTSDCKALLDKVRKKVDHWRNKFLSYAGKLLLIASVLEAIRMLQRSIQLYQGPSDITVWNKALLHFKYEIGDGKKIYMWFDNWSGLGPLINYISNRSLYDERIKRTCHVADLVGSNSWNWPAEYENVNCYSLPVLKEFCPEIQFVLLSGMVLMKRRG
ncbi:RNA-directed DNA polymerase, eukaryota, reverse transcriptase zinc-binding domain protein [Tanacetum coccineum]